VPWVPLARRRFFSSQWPRTAKQSSGFTWKGAAFENDRWLSWPESLLPENYPPYILERNEEMHRIGRGPAAKVHLPPATRTAPALSRA
jgi:hypothetical protein